jgi:hypothetical protein
MPSVLPNAITSAWAQTKGISKQTMAPVPSNDASKQNTNEATFALMLCQRDSCNPDVIGGPKEW